MRPLWHIHCTHSDSDSYSWPAAVRGVAYDNTCSFKVQFLSSCTCAYCMCYSTRFGCIVTRACGAQDASLHSLPIVTYLHSLPIAEVVLRATFAMNNSCVN